MKNFLRLFGAGILFIVVFLFGVLSTAQLVFHLYQVYEHWYLLNEFNSGKFGVAMSWLLSTAGCGAVIAAYLTRD